MYANCVCLAVAPTALVSNLPRAGDAIHPALRKKAGSGFETTTVSTAACFSYTNTKHALIAILITVRRRPCKIDLIKV